LLVWATDGSSRKSTIRGAALVPLKQIKPAPHRINTAIYRHRLKAKETGNVLHLVSAQPAQVSCLHSAASAGAALPLELLAAVGLAAWMYDYNNGEPERLLTKDAVLEDLTLY
jgi:hypothetical protein